MNETGLILEQIRIEREHAGEVLARAQAAAREHDHASDGYSSFCAACLAYLKFVEGRVRARVAAHRERLRGMNQRRATTGESSGSITAALAELLALEPQLSRQSPAEEFLGLNIDKLTAYSDKLVLFMKLAATLDALAAGRYAVEDWRAVAHIDADGMLEERRRYHAVMTHPFFQSMQPA